MAVWDGYDFCYRPSAPAAVTSTKPADGATGGACRFADYCYVSANMNGATITTGADGTTGGFKIVPAITVPPAAAVTGATASYDSANFRANLSHTGPLAYGTNYTATLTNTITDAAGNAHPAVCTWQFTTASVPDITPPSIVSSSPGNPTTTGTGVEYDA